MFAAELGGIKALPNSLLHELASGNQTEYQEDHVGFSINSVEANLQDHPFGLGLASCNPTGKSSVI